MRQISDIYLAKVRQFSTAQSASCAFARTGRFPFFRVRFVMILLGGLCRLGGLDASWVMDGHGYNVIVSHEETCKIYVMAVFPCFKRNSGCSDCSMSFLQAVKFWTLAPSSPTPWLQNRLQLGAGECWRSYPCNVLMVTTWLAWE